MRPLKLIIIGNQFEKFSNNNGIITYDEFNLLIHAKNTFTDEQKIYQIYLGQGLSDLQIDTINQNITQGGLENRFFLTGPLYSLRRSPNDILYKNKTENGIISEPENISDNLYRSYLLLSEELHMKESAKYIKGTTLMDASRQMVMNVSKRCLLSSRQNSPKDCVIHQMNATFLANILPLDVAFFFKINTIRHGLYGNFKSTGSIQAIQNKKTMMTIDIDFTVIDKKTLSDIETQQAASAVAELFNTADLRSMNQFAA